VEPTPLASTSVTSGPGGYLFQLVVSVYGGFFGAGMGILMIAALAIQGFKDVHEINALKNWLSAVIYSVAVATFVIADAVSWPHTLIMLVTATIGGYWGAAVARKLPAIWLRRFIIAVGGCSRCTTSARRSEPRVRRPLRRARRRPASGGWCS
jgi:Predicted permeases